MRSNADGLPPRCTWPKTVILVSCFKLSTIIFLTSSAVIGLLFLSTAPSETIIIFNLCPAALSYIIKQKRVN